MCMVFTGRSITNHIYSCHSHHHICRVLYITSQPLHNGIYRDNHFHSCIYILLVLSNSLMLVVMKSKMVTILLFYFYTIPSHLDYLSVVLVTKIDPKFIQLGKLLFWYVESRLMRLGEYFQ